MCLDPRGHSNGSMLTPPGCTEDEVDEQLEADLIAAAKLLTEEGGGDGEAGEEVAVAETPADGRSDGARAAPGGVESDGGKAELRMSL